MIKQTLTSEYPFNNGSQPTELLWGLYSSELLATEKISLYLSGLSNPATECNVIKLSKVITKDFVSAGTFSKIDFWTTSFQGGLDNINIGFYYDWYDESNGAIEPEKRFAHLGDFFADETLAVLNLVIDTAQVVENSKDGTFPHLGVDLLVDRLGLGGTIKNVELVLWYGLAVNIDSALEQTTPPTFNSFWLQITQQA